MQSANEPYILCKISSFENSSAQRVSVISNSNFQKRLIVLCSLIFCSSITKWSAYANVNKYSPTSSWGNFLHLITYGKKIVTIKPKFVRNWIKKLICVELAFARLIFFFWCIPWSKLIFIYLTYLDQFVILTYLIRFINFTYLDLFAYLIGLMLTSLSTGLKWVNLLK